MCAHARASYGRHVNSTTASWRTDERPSNVKTVNRMTTAIFDQDHDTLAKIFTDDLVFHLRGPRPDGGRPPGPRRVARGRSARGSRRPTARSSSTSSSASGPTAGPPSGNTPRWVATARPSSRATPSCTGSTAIGSPRCGCSSARCPTRPRRSSPDRGRRVARLGAWCAPSRTLERRATTTGGVTRGGCGRRSTSTASTSTISTGSATAAYLTGHDEEGVRPLGASPPDVPGRRSACIGRRTSEAKLAQGLGFKGDLGRCRGWVDRTARLLDEADIDCVEQGYLEWGLGDDAASSRPATSPGAHAHFVQAGKIGARFAHRELVTSARDRRRPHADLPGRDRRRDWRCSTRPWSSIEAGELSPLATGDAYCTVIDACAELFDLGRCRAWTESFVRWCDTQQELVLYRGHCFLHRAEVLELLGAWPEALVEARHACDRLAAPVNPAALGAAPAYRGRSPPPRRRLRRRRGRLSSAPASSAATPSPASRCSDSPKAGSTAADAMIRRALDEAEDPMSRARRARPLRRDHARRRRHGRRPRRCRRAPSSGGHTRHTAPASARRPRRAAQCSEPRATRRPRSSSCAERLQRVPRPRRALRRRPHPAAHRRAVRRARRPRRSRDGDGRGARSCSTRLADGRRT